MDENYYQALYHDFKKQQSKNVKIRGKRWYNN